MISFSYLSTPQQLIDLTENYIESSIKEVAMDFEEESNLHVYGEHLCTVQLFDRTNYYVVDALELQKTEEGKKALALFFESPIEKIMFDCSSDSAIVRKTLGIQLKNIFDLRLLAKALEFDGNLTALEERNLGIVAEDPALKKKYQRANWMKRPISEEQLEYALSDVSHLFELKESLLKEVSKLPVQTQRHLESLMKNCANQKHKDRPGWEKICNYKALSKRQKVFIRYFFNARDALARKADVPAVNILEKQIIVAMAKTETWEGLLSGIKLRYSGVFEKARLQALEELKAKDEK